MEMMDDEIAGDFRFVFPDAPHSLADIGMPQGRAWWPLNMAQLQQAVQSSRFKDLHDKTPPGIDEARNALCETIEAVKEGLGGDDTPIVLGGFSQGAMLSMDAACRGMKSPPEALFLFSGTLVCKSAWQASMGRLADCKIYQSHGTLDPILPFDSATALRDLMGAGKLKVKFHSFDGPHTIDGESIPATAEILMQVAGR
jgi:phospholipase/carboxylesterase